jgi:alkaline phosphatase
MKGKYVDGFVLSVPRSKLGAYRKMSLPMGKMVRKFGALDYKECVGDDMHPKGMGGMKFRVFPRLVKPKKGEVVLFSFIVFKSKAHRNSVNRKVMKEMKKMMKDPKMKKMMESLPFDMKRMSYGGFKVIVQA